jgi:hypothetical protein
MDRIEKPHPLTRGYGHVAFGEKRPHKPLTTSHSL